jgi:hypothetical protein
VTRTLSHTEIQTVTTCEAKHALSYTGHLTGGSTLKAKTVAPVLRDGRAWGRGVAAYCENVLRTDADVIARQAICASLEEDYDEQVAAGVADMVALDEARAFLFDLLDHYIETTEPLPITRPEHELDVPIPARNSHRASRRYRFQAFLDGLHEDDDGRVWVVEFKLRGKLTPLPQLYRDRQIRRYAWAGWRALDIDPVGVIVDERLKEVPKAPRVLKSGKPSHAKDQLCAAGAYRAVCEEHGVEMDRETFDALNARRWQQREAIMFRPGELAEVGEELVSAAWLIRDLDSGRRAPILNPSNAHCNGCQFREICPELSDGLIDMSFRRTVPKRLRSADDLAGSVPVSTDGQGVPDLHVDAAASPEPSPSSEFALSGATDRSGGGAFPSVVPGRSTPVPDLDEVPF